MILNQHGNPIENHQRGKFAMGAGQATIDGPIDEVAPANYISQPRSPWETWEFQELDTDNLHQYSIDQLLDIMVSVSPEVNVSLWHVNRFVNPYFWFEFENPDDPASLEAMDRLMGIFTNYYGGFDTLVSQSVAGLFTRGGCFEELVFAPMQGGMMEPVDLLVRDPYWVRFQKIDDPVRGRVWHYGQWIDGTFTSFQEDPTILYLPIDPYPGPMYGRSLMGSSIFCVVYLIALMRDVRRVIANQGYPRLDVSVDLEMLRPIYEDLKLAEDSTPDFPAWAMMQLENIQELYNKLKPHQAFIHTSDIQVNPHVGTLNSQGLGMLDGIIRIIERMLVRGLKTVPLLHGSNESLAESQADAQWVIYAESIRSLQRTISQMRSQLFTYALQMQGIMNKVTLHFGSVNEMQAKRRAETRQLEIQNIILQMDAGLITMDEGRAEVANIKSERMSEFRGVMIDRQYYSYLGNDSKHTHFDIGSLPPSPTDCCSGSDDAGVFAVQISPEGSDDAMPEIPESVTISDVEATEARQAWNMAFSQYRDLLAASVINMLPAGGLSEVIKGNWEWNDSTKRYRNTESGRWVTDNSRLKLKSDFIDKQLPVLNRWSVALRDGTMSIQEWVLSMRRLIRKSYMTEFLFAKGGVNAMTASDLNLVGDIVKSQYQFLNNFAEQMGAGELSVAQIRSRSEMYVLSSRQSYERGQASSYGIELPEYPADGNQQCRSRCKCRWYIVRKPDGIEARWLMNIAAEHCESCRENTAKWNPFWIPNPTT